MSNPMLESIMASFKIKGNEAIMARFLEGKSLEELKIMSSLLADAFEKIDPDFFTRMSGEEKKKRKDEDESTEAPPAETVNG